MKMEEKANLIEVLVHLLTFAHPENQLTAAAVKMLTETKKLSREA